MAGRKGTRAGGVCSPPQCGLGKGKTSFSSYFKTSRRGADSRKPRASLAIERPHPGVCRSAQSEGGIPARPLRALPTAGAVRPSRPPLSLPPLSFLPHVLTTCLFTTSTRSSFLLNLLALQRHETLSGPFLILQPQHVAGRLSEIGSFPLIPPRQLTGSQPPGWRITSAPSIQEGAGKPYTTSRERGKSPRYICFSRAPLGSRFLCWEAGWAVSAGTAPCYVRPPGGKSEWQLS